MTLAANKLPAKGSATRRMRRHRLVWAVLFAGVVSAAGVAVYRWRQAVAPEATPSEIGVAEPPAVDLTGVDPAVRRAIEAACAAVVQSPRSADAWGRLGMILLSHGLSADAANTCFTQAERLNPSEPRWPYFQGTSLLATDTEAAVAKLRRAAELCGSASDAPRLQLAEVLLDQGRLTEAADQFHRVLQRHPANARASLGLGRVAYQRGDLAECLNHLARSVADVHTRKASHLLLAQVHQLRGDPSAAQQALRQASNLPADRAWPDRFLDEVTQLRLGKQTSLARADHLLRQGRTAEAIALLGQTVRDYPDAAWAWVMLGRAHLGRNDLPAAERALRKAVELGPDVAEAQFYLGVALILQKQHGAAAACFRKATQLKPDFALAHYNLGHCLKEQGDRSGAIEAFRLAVSCQPGHAPSHVNLGELLAKDGQHGAALVHLRYALQLNPADPGAKKLLAQELKQIAIPIGP